MVQLWNYLSRDASGFKHVEKSNFLQSETNVVNFSPRSLGIQIFRSVTREVRRIFKFVYPPLRYGNEITTFKKPRFGP